jgi:hypothetical protein
MQKITSAIITNGSAMLYRSALMKVKESVLPTP